jgi:apolipoprotein N-acyltransferase
VSFKKILLSILSGVMLSASFPPGELGWLAWIAVVPLLIALENERPSNAFKFGMIMGLSHYLTLIYWVIFVVHTYGGIGLFTSVFILFLFCIYLSLFPAFFSLLINLPDSNRFMPLKAAAIWVSLEYVRAVLLTGFPWCLIGYSQYARHYLIQISDITGVYGISFLLVSFNGAIYLLLFGRKKVSSIGGRVTDVLIVLMLILVCFTYGIYSLADMKKDLKGKEPMVVSVIQGNIDQSVKWDPAFMRETMEKYITLTKSTIVSKPGLIVWPETAAPFYFQDNTDQSKEIYKISKETGAWLIFGCPAYETDIIQSRYYNRIYVVSPNGYIEGHYDKTHLVPFGEYVPLKKFMPFINRLVTAAGDFSAGKESGILKMHGLKAGALICYEGIFPDIARKETKNGAQLFVNLSNDAWFGMTSAPYQLLSMCVFRATENRRPFVRAANTGISAFIDSYGRITERSDLFVDGVLTGQIPTGFDRLTIYSKYGDIFIYFILTICLIKFFHELCYHLLKSNLRR